MGSKFDALKIKAADYYYKLRAKGLSDDAILSKLYHNFGFIMDIGQRGLSLVGVNPVRGKSYMIDYFSKMAAISDRLEKERRKIEDIRNAYNEEYSKTKDVVLLKKIMLDMDRVVKYIYKAQEILDYYSTMFS